MIAPHDPQATRIVLALILAVIGFVALARMARDMRQPAPAPVTKTRRGRSGVMLREVDPSLRRN
jgi:hypothetical protein